VVITGQGAFNALGRTADETMAAMREGRSGIGALDFEGSNGMSVSLPVWFLGGMLLGMISPGKTFIEPVVASFLVAIPTVFYLARGETVRTMPVFMYVIMALIGVMFTLIGAYLGERIQMGPPPKAAD